MKLEERFWKADEEERFSGNETRLFFVLLREKEKKIYDDVLAEKVGVSLKTMREARKRLKERQMLDYESGIGKGVKTEYIFDTSQQSKPTPKKEKKEEKIKVVVVDKEGASIGKRYKLAIGKRYKLEDISAEVKLHQMMWVERFCMNEHIRLTEFNVMLSLFITQLQNDGEKEKEMSDFQKHFSRWFNIQKEKNEGRHKENRTGFVPSDATKEEWSESF